MKKKVCIIAASGSVSKEVIKLLTNDNELEISAGYVRKESKFLGLDLGLISGAGQELNIKAGADLEKMIAGCDVIIDFSRAKLSLEVLATAIKYQKPLVCGSTGFTTEEKEKFNEGAKTIPLMYSDNTSRLENIMMVAMGYISSKLNENTDIDIIEKHSKTKIDTPSGTSKDMREIIQEKQSYQHKLEIHSIRSSNIQTEHTIIFGTDNERVELFHQAYNNAPFAAGAIVAAKYLLNKTAGRYLMKDIFNL